MASSLATQLAQNASLNSALLVDRSRRKPTASYLFTGREADDFDLEVVHALAVNGFLQLIRLDSSIQGTETGGSAAEENTRVEEVEDLATGGLARSQKLRIPTASQAGNISRLEQFEDEIFSDAMKGTDRTLLSQERVKELDDVLERFMRELGPWLLEPPCGRVIEYLVRRFRINEFNIDAVLRLFLPYHESPHFAKMLSILTIKPNSMWSFMLPFKSAAQSLSRTALVTAMSKDTDVARFVASIMQNTIQINSNVKTTTKKRKIKALSIHRPLTAFTVVTLLEFIDKSRKLDEGTMAFLLPAIMEPLKIAKEAMKGDGVNYAVPKDTILASYVLLVAVSRKCDLVSKALSVVVAVMASSARLVKVEQFLNALVAVCEPQAALRSFSDSTVKNIIGLSDIEPAILNLLVFNGIEKILQPMVGTLVRWTSQETACSIIETLISSSHTPTAVIAQLAELLIPAATTSNAPAAEVATARRLLSAIQQRHPAILQNSGKRLIENEEGLKDQIEQLMISLSITHVSAVSSSASGTDANSKVLELVLGSTSADAPVRVLSLKGLIQSLNTDKDSLSEDDLKSVQSALIARIQDTAAEVLDVLYNDPGDGANPALPVLMQDVHALVSNIIRALGTGNTSTSGTSGGAEVKVKKGLMRLHLGFIVTHVLEDHSGEVDPAVAENVFWGIIFPFLLYSKPRQHTAELVWETVKELEERVGSKSVESPPKKESAFEALGPFELLKGCAKIMTEKGRDAGNENSVERMVLLNDSIAKTIADNVLKSDGFHQHVDVLLKNLKDSNSHLRNLSYLVIRVLIGLLSGVQQIDIALRAFDAAGLLQFEFGAAEGTSKKEAHDKALDEGSLGKAIVAKPSNPSTTQYLQISLISLFASISRPADATLNWLSSSTSETSDATISQEERRDKHYVQLIQSVYKFAITGLNAPVLTTSILGTLFITLKDDVLALLAGFWSDNLPPIPPNGKGVSDEDQVEKAEFLRYVALKHGTALLNAHWSGTADGEGGSGIDFQTVIPALIIALQSEERRCRDAAFECVTLLRGLAEKKFVSVYKFDVIYGADDAQLQYLEQSDVKKYLDALVQDHDHLALDHKSVVLFHRQHLAYSKTDKRKEYDYKRRVLCYILSHTNAVRSTSGKVALLRSLAAISDSAKILLMLPTIKSLLDVAAPKRTQDTETEELVNLLLANFDASTVKGLNGQGKEGDALWELYKQVLRAYFSTDAPKSIRRTLANILRQSIFSGLLFERQVEVTQIFLEISIQGIETQSFCKPLLRSLIQKVPLLVHLLASLQPQAPSTTARPPKRAKTNEEDDDPIPKLTLLLESLDNEVLQGSLDLISALLDTLNRVIGSKKSFESDGNYLEQLLMSAVEVAAEKITEIPNVRPSAIRLDILVELIRVSSNPQTFNQALLLMASLARLAPDAVLHNIMPVFTFMGSNVFHRDDSYSFNVVQKTIENIVPVMVSSLKKEQSLQLDLYKKSKDFLTIFTDAATHIPRHRRNNFYTHLVTVLGSHDFLAPVVMLLIEKTANRVVRQSPEDLDLTLSLPLAVIQHHPPELQLHSLTEIVTEAQRVARRITDPETSKHGFLDGPRQDEHSLSVASLLERLSHALVIFVGHALRNSPTPSQPVTGATGMADLVAALIDLASLSNTSAKGSKVKDIVQAARTSLNNALNVMAAKDFIEAIASMLQSSETIQLGALELLADRIANVATTTREQITSTVISILDAIKTIISSHANTPRVTASLRALTSIATTLVAGEENAMTTLLPHLVASTKVEGLTTHALATLSPFPEKLGPRILPYFREIVQTSINILRTTDASSAAPSAAHQEAVNVLNNMLTYIPQFWGTIEIKLIFDFYIDQASVQDSPPWGASVLVKSIAKKLPAKTLPIINDLWVSVKQTPNSRRIAAYFDIMSKVIRASGSKLTTESLRPLFSTFLEAFTAVAALPEKESEIRVINAFKELVTKLNEAAFRPLFRRLFDWAFASENTNIAQKITFSNLFLSLLDYFKGLVNSYMSFLQRPFVEFLAQPLLKGDEQQILLWTRIVEIITKSLNYDDGAYWRDEKLRDISSPLLKHLPSYIEASVDGTDLRPLFQDCTIALVDNITDDVLVKSVNLNLLMHSRADDIRTKLFVLGCSTAVWLAHGGKLAGYAEETATFISESLEDENEMVVRETLNLKNAVESVAGSIEGL